MTHAEAIELIKRGGLVVRLLLRRVNISSFTGNRLNLIYYLFKSNVLNLNDLIVSLLNAR